MRLLRLLRWWLILRALRKLRLEQEAKERAIAERDARVAKIEDMIATGRAPVRSALDKLPEIDPTAMRLAHETPFKYDFCKHVLDSMQGDEMAAEAFLQLTSATNGAVSLEAFVNAFKAEAN